ncbi:MAG: type 1 periplasmic-binding domain-containing protein [Acidimicrobiales bacterium]
MTPSMQFRLWLREAPGGERLAAGIGALVLAALIAWVVVPTNGRSSSGLLAANGASSLSAGSAGAGAVAGTVAGQTRAQPNRDAGGTGTGSSQTGGAGPAGPGGQVVDNGGPAQASASRGGTSGCPTGSSPSTGVTATQLHVGIALVALAGSVGNTTFAVPTVEQQQQDFAAVVDAVNKAGGVQCRQLVATYYQADPLDQSNEHAVCLQAVQHHEFALLDPEALDTPTSARDCVPQHKLPLFDVAPVDALEVSQFAPYLVSATASLEQTTKNLVFGLRQLGFFNGFKKIGVLEDDCYADIKSDFASYMAQIGIRTSDMSVADFGCPTDTPPPTQAQQAVLQFEAAGVTHVIDIGTGSPEVTNFSSFAQSQGYHPRYGLADFNWVAVTSSSYEAPNASNFNGAISITPAAFGAQNSGTPLGAAIVACDQIMASHGLPPVEKQGQFFGGTVCNLVWLFVHAAERDPSLSQSGLRDGLDQLGHYDLSFPSGPATFTTAHPGTGGGSWRPVTYNGGCACWKVLNPTWQPDFSVTDRAT